MWQSPAESPLAAGAGWTPLRGSGIVVLGGREQRRPAAMVYPLDRRLSGRAGTVGLEVAVTASVAELLRIPPTAVIVATADTDFADVVTEVQRAVIGILDLEEVDDPLLTVAVAAPNPVRPESAGELCLYNLHLEAFSEALVESVAAARRADLVTPNGNCTLLVQPFSAAKASAVVYANPDRELPVRISGRWGLTEDDEPADLFEVAPDGRTVWEKLAQKPTANVTAHGGTQTVDLSDRCQHQSSLSRETVLGLAAQARAVSSAAGRSLSLDVAMFDADPVVLRCRPALPSLL